MPLASKIGCERVSASQLGADGYPMRAIDALGRGDGLRSHKVAADNSVQPSIEGRLASLKQSIDAVMQGDEDFSLLVNMIEEVQGDLSSYQVSGSERLRAELAAQQCEPISKEHEATIDVAGKQSAGLAACLSLNDINSAQSKYASWGKPDGDMPFMAAIGLAGKVGSSLNYSRIPISDGRLTHLQDL
ncbi:hypothetical protein E1162_05945 [Rhodobacteraceae bacterium RKSG542]|uniref:hypothetical protein n=1 Tax=Pseudovibrio flavus TaxID=2529854 RepID=UPI0012BCBA58|nr:hypothetical protein [Pseudovibrio flavus]MTI16775.1 hypothetical protein [Pseudovibrio flavus]